MKKLSFLIALALAVAMIAGCAGTPVVYYSDCTCPTGSHDVNTDENKTDDTVLSDGEMKTGLALITDITQFPT